MKAGIYLDPVGNLIYVAKDRTIKAMSCDDFGARKVGAKVSHRAKDDTVQIEGTDYRCTRHADVPNGCTDHQALVDSMHMAANLEPGQRVVDYGTKSARVEETDGTPDGITEDGNAIDLKTTADDPYKRMAEHMRGCEKATRHVGGAARRFYSGGAVPQAGDILIEFEDNGQDFLRWTLRDDAEGYTRVIDSQPYQRDVWAGMIVHNADNLVSGRTDVAYVGRDPEDSRNLLHRVTSAKRVDIGKLQMLALDTERRFVGVPPALAAPYGETDLVEWRKKFSASLREQGFRVCHTRSARKHKKQGHTVVPLHDNWFAWRPADYLHPYQRDLVNRFKGLTLKVPASLGKTETMAVPRTLIYVGSLEHLKGKKALTMPARSSGVLLAQFDDITATRSGEPLPEVETPEPPVDALGFHWHEFPSADFAAAGA